jgi:hypothetical protein
MGNAVGLGLSIPKALFKVEYRIFDDGFRPTIFDYTYDSSPVFLGMDTEEGEDEAQKGYFSMLAWRPISKVDLLATFEDYDNTEPKLYVGLTESGLVDRLSFRAFYVKRNIGEPNPDGEDPGFFEDFFDLDDKSAFTMRIGYEVLPSLELAVIREYRFQQIQKAGYDGEEETTFEPIQKTSVEVGFKLNF